MRLSGAKRRALIDATAEVLRCGEPTVFALYGTCRSGLRVAFIWRGASWATADELACRIVLGALALLGARWPTWLEGQPEYTQYGVSIAPREKCLRCDRPMPDDMNPLAKFCSPACRMAAHNDRWRADHREELAAYHRAYYVAHRHAAQG